MWIKEIKEKYGLSASDISRIINRPPAFFSQRSTLKGVDKEKFKKWEDSLSEAEIYFMKLHKQRKNMKRYLPSRLQLDKLGFNDLEQWTMFKIWS